MEMTDTVDFRALFLEASELPAKMTLLKDQRSGFTEAGDHAYRRHRGQHVGMMVWEGADDQPIRLLVDIRWLFPDAEAAAAYHLATLQAKAEGKPENPTLQKFGQNCHTYSYPSGRGLSQVEDIFAQVLGAQHAMARGLGDAIAKMPDDGFIFLFTLGPVAVKSLVLLNNQPAAAAHAAPVQEVMKQIVSRVDRLIPQIATGKPQSWWKKLTS
jgi:hypothetical protein